MGAGEGLVGHLAEAGGDAGVAVFAEFVDREVVQGGHALGAVSGADLGAALIEGGVPDEVQPVLDHPLWPYEAGDSFRAA